MCTAGYFATHARSQAAFEVSEFFATVEAMAGIPKTVIRPTNESPFVRLEGDGLRHLRRLRWGLVPYWSKEPRSAYPTHNARGETLAEKPAFREAYKRRRGIMAWVSYVEWREERGVKVPYEFAMASGEPIGFASLWDRWGKDDDYFESCTMVTCEPNELASPYHDRMPAILRPEDYNHWLDPDAQPGDLAALLTPYPADLMIAEPANPDDFKRPKVLKVASNLFE